MLYGASGGLLALGIVFITREETRWVGIFWLLAAAVRAEATLFTSRTLPPCSPEMTLPACAPAVAGRAARRPWTLPSG